MTSQEIRTPAPFKDYYAALRLSLGASSTDVHRKYRELVWEYSLDTDEGLPARLAELNEAYHVLASRAFRQEYDQRWIKMASRPTPALADATGEEYVPAPAPPPPLAVMAKQHYRPKPRVSKKPPKRRFLRSQLVLLLGLAASVCIIVGVPVIAAIV